MQWMQSSVALRSNNFINMAAQNNRQYGLSTVEQAF